MGAEESAAAVAPVEVGGRAQLARRAGVVSAAVLVVSAITLAGIWFAPALVTAIAPGFAHIPGKVELTVTLTRIMFPFLLLVALAAVAMGILNTRHIFGVPAAASAFFNLGSIVGGLGCAAWLAPGYLSGVLGRGPAPDPSLVTRAMTGMAIGTLAGGLLQLLAQVPSLWRVGFRYRPLLAGRHPGLPHHGRAGARAGRALLPARRRRARAPGGPRDRPGLRARPLCAAGHGRGGRGAGGLRARPRGLRRHQGAGAGLLRARRRPHADAGERALDGDQLRPQLALRAAARLRAPGARPRHVRGRARQLRPSLRRAPPPRRGLRAGGGHRPYRARDRGHGRGRLGRGPGAGGRPPGRADAPPRASPGGGDPGRGRGLLGRVSRPRGGGAGAPPPRPGLRPAAARSAASSRGVTSRQAPGGSVPSATGPSRTRASLSTRCPTASHRRRTRCVRPSTTVSSSQVLVGSRPSTRTRAGALLPSSRRTPRRRRVMASSDGVPSTFTR